MHEGPEGLVDVGDVDVLRARAGGVGGQRVQIHAQQMTDGAAGLPGGQACVLLGVEHHARGMAPQVVLIVADDRVVEVVHAVVHALSIIAVGAVVVDVGVALQPGLGVPQAAEHVDAPVLPDVAPEQVVGAAEEAVGRAFHLAVLALAIRIGQVAILGTELVEHEFAARGPHEMKRHESVSCGMGRVPARARTRLGRRAAGMAR